MKRSAWLFGIVFLFAFLGFVCLATDAQDAATPKGKIVFTKRDADTGKLFVINADGSGIKEIGTSTKMNFYPAWSPDGKRIAYTGFDSLQTVPSIYAANNDGTEEVRVTSGVDFAIIPSWSPDGKQILCTSIQSGRKRGLRLLNLDGSVAMDFNIGDGFGIFGFWSPDGKRIGYTRAANEMRTGPVCLMKADGNETEVLTQGIGFNICGHGGWSPNGKTLAVVRVDPATDQGSLWLIDIASKSENKVADVVERKSMEPMLPTAAWSPDGKWLAVAIFDKNNKSRIFLISADGKTRKPLTAENDSCFGPSWTK